MSSDTPRTDNAAGDGTTVPADFAADLERELNAAKAEVEKLRAELARLTTLRPIAEWQAVPHHAMYWYRRNDGGMYGLQARFDHCLGWTPLPDVKETK